MADAAPQSSAARTRRQQGLFFGGLAFVAFSSLITRRALNRRLRPLAVRPAAPLSRGSPSSQQAPGYRSAAEAAAQPGQAGQAAHDAAPDAAAELANSGPLIAVEALTLATLNVFSFSVMATGGLLWYFDIASMDEMRTKIRSAMGTDTETQREAEQEMEEWLAETLARKEDKERARKLTEARAKGA